MTDERGLSEALQRRADGLGHTHPLSLEDVQGKARGIRRRRTAISGLAAATVLGVTAPFALSLGDDATTPDRAPEVAANEPASSGVKDGVLTTDISAEGAAPGVPYLYDGAIHLPEGGTVPVADEWTGFGTFGDGFVVSDGSTLAVLTSDGEVTVEAPTSGSFAVSPDHSLVAFLDDGAVQWIAADGSSGAGIPIPAVIESPELVAVGGEESCDPAHSGGGCTFFLNSDGQVRRGWSLTSKGIINPLGDFLHLNDAALGGWTSGVVEIDELEPSSCSEVWADPFADGPAWDTCESTPTEFSPDGSMVIGAPAYRDGFGDSSLAILDNTDGGRVLAEWQNSEKHQAWITSSAWDADGSVLATVSEGGGWALMRFSPDGGLSKVMDLESDDPESAPLVLPEGS